MVDLNDLRVFERVGALRSFAGAARALSLPRSNVSRSVARLETALGVRLIHRTTREVELTPAGESLMTRCAGALTELGEALGYVGSLATEAHGELRISAGIGFGINVIADQLPAFLERYPDVAVVLDLTSRNAELVAERVDVAVRLGPLSDSSMVAVKLGEMKRVLCGSPAYLARSGEPTTPEDLTGHEVIEMPGPDGRSRTWSFSRGGRSTEVVVDPRVAVNDALTIHRLVCHGAGIGIISRYLCAAELEAKRLVHLLPEWTSPAVDVHLVFPSKRELAPAVRGIRGFHEKSEPVRFALAKRRNARCRLSWVSAPRLGRIVSRTCEWLQNRFRVQPVDPSSRCRSTRTCSPTGRPMSHVDNPEARRRYPWCRAASSPDSKRLRYDRPDGGSVEYQGHLCG